MRPGSREEDFDPLAKLKKDVAKLRDAIERTETALAQSPPWETGGEHVDIYERRDSEGRFIMLDALAAYVRGQAVILDAEERSKPDKLEVYNDELTLSKVREAFRNIMYQQFQTDIQVDLMIDLLKQRGILFKYNQ